MATPYDADTQIAHYCNLNGDTCCAMESNDSDFFGFPGIKCAIHSFVVNSVGGVAGWVYNHNDLNTCKLAKYKTVRVEGGYGTKSTKRLLRGPLWIPCTSRRTSTVLWQRSRSVMSA